RILVLLSSPSDYFLLFFLTHHSTAEIYTLSLHDALPILKNQESGEELDICEASTCSGNPEVRPGEYIIFHDGFQDDIDSGDEEVDRKSTRLNSSHVSISYAVFCLKKKNIFKQTCCMLVHM